MSLGIDYATFGAVNPYTGSTPSSVVDTYNNALENNGASQILGSLYFAPLDPSHVNVGGAGLQNGFKYVRYNPTASQVIQAGPALVYWKDETFTTVTPLSTEAYLPALQSSGIAGWLLYNTTTTPGATASVINGNLCWIQVAGFIPGAYSSAATTAGVGIYGVSANATPWVTTITAPAPARLAGIALGATSAANLVDLYVPLIY